MKAIYRLRDHFPTFEFYNWLVMVKAKGATEIVFDLNTPRLNKKHQSFTQDYVMERFRSIVEPGPALARLSSRHIVNGETTEVDADASTIIEWARAGNKIPRLFLSSQQMVMTAPDILPYYTVTIRYNIDGGARGRDSNQEAWRRFAEQIGAHVIEDYHEKPIHLHDRMVLYAGAKMNFGVCNGPVYLLTLTPYPVTMVVNSLVARRSQAKWGVPEGTNYPWCLPTQRMVWVKDTYDNLMRTFDSYVAKAA